MASRMRDGVRQKLCGVHTIGGQRHTEMRTFLAVFLYNYIYILYIYIYLYIYRGLCISPLPPPPPSPSISHVAPVHSKPVLDVCFREEEVLLIVLLYTQHKEAAETPSYTQVVGALWGKQLEQGAYSIMVNKFVNISRCLTDKNSPTRSDANEGHARS